MGIPILDLPHVKKMGEAWQPTSLLKDGGEQAHLPAHLSIERRGGHPHMSEDVGGGEPHLS